MKPMLAGEYIEAKIEKNLPLYAQPKLDGIRMFIRGGVAYSRSLKPIRSELVKSLIPEYAWLLEGLDGEIIAGDPTAPDAYRRTDSAIMSFNKPDDLIFHVFDTFDMRDMPFEDRLQYLRDLRLPDFCRLVPTTLLHSMEEIREYEEDLLDKGHEGVILRNPNSPYKFGRGTPSRCELIKLKRFTDAEATVTGFLELQHNHNEAIENALGYAERSSHKENLTGGETLGALLAKGKFKNGVPYKVRIGTGFDAAQRKEIWENRDYYLGKLVKFKFFDKGMKEAPRFPVFLGFRDNDDLSPPDEPTPIQGDLFDE